jgi:hypothetical protein
MAKERPMYEVVDEFIVKASQIVEKYPTVFYGVNVDGIRCVKIVNKDRPEKNGNCNLLKCLFLWTLHIVIM